MLIDHHSVAKCISLALPLYEVGTTSDGFCALCSGLNWSPRFEADDSGLARRAFEVERDADTERRLRAPKGKKHPSASCALSILLFSERKRDSYFGLSLWMA